MFIKPDNWKDLSPEQRKKLRLDHWEKAEGVKFKNKEAESKYRERARRLRMAYDLATPDRIIADISMGAGEYAVRRRGLNGKDVLYNHDKLFDPILQFNEEFQPDLGVGTIPYPGKIFDILDFKTYIWGGQKLPDNQVIQAVEGEYMMPDEYADFIRDPSGFWMKKYLPRMFGALLPSGMLSDLPQVCEVVDVARFVMPFGMPPVREMFKKLLDAGEEAMKWAETIRNIGAAVESAGFPGMALSFAKAPFDYLGDTLRGTKGIMMDLYRRPKEVTAACERYVPIIISSTVAGCDFMGAPKAMFPLHKGADGFMSQKHFETIYWPTLKAVMLGLYEEGITNYMFVEGSYESRLETIADLPKGAALWHFDRTDMRKAKSVLGGRFPIAGNVPASLMSTGTADQVRAKCDELVELFDGNPGYIMAFGCGFEMTADDKLHAFIDSVKK